MRSFSTLAITATSALLFAQASAEVIYSSCLDLSEQTAGQTEPSTGFTNADQLTSSPDGDDTMHLHSFKTCTNTDENIQGIQFTLSSDAYGDPEATLFELDPLGTMEGNCSTMTIQGPLSRIRATFTDGTGMTGIAYFRGDVKKTYGNVSEEDYSEWMLSDDSPLIGVSGSISSNGVIQRLGLITLDLQCQEDSGQHVSESSQADTPTVEDTTEIQQEEVETPLFEDMGESEINVDDISADQTNLDNLEESIESFSSVPNET